MGFSPVKKNKPAACFFCKFFNREVQRDECIDDYVNATALNIRHSPCYKCPQGLKNRIEYANS